MSQTVLIFGHTSGLGYALTSKYLAENHNVVGISRRESDAKSDNLTNIQADLSSESEINKVVSEVRKLYSNFDALLFCTGVLTSHALDKLNFNQMQAMFKVNNFAPMTIESGLLDLIKQNHADVMNVTSDAAFNFYENYYEYSASKLALQKFTSDLQKALKDYPCRVMDFCPSGFQSNIRKVATRGRLGHAHLLHITATKTDRNCQYICKSESQYRLALNLKKLPTRL